MRSACFRACKAVRPSRSWVRRFSAILDLCLPTADSWEGDFTFFGRGSAVTAARYSGDGLSGRFAGKISRGVGRWPFCLGWYGEKAW